MNNDKKFSETSYLYTNIADPSKLKPDNKKINVYKNDSSEVDNGNNLHAIPSESETSKSSKSEKSGKSRKSEKSAKSNKMKKTEVNAIDNVMPEHKSAKYSEIRNRAGNNRNSEFNVNLDKRDNLIQTMPANNSMNNNQMEDNDNVNNSFQSIKQKNNSKNNSNNASFVKEENIKENTKEENIKESSGEYFKDLVLLILSIIEMASRYFSFIGIHLDGFTDNIKPKFDANIDVFKDLERKYTGSSSSYSPETKLLWIIITGAVGYHLTQSFKKREEAPKAKQMQNQSFYKNNLHNTSIINKLQTQNGNKMSTPDTSYAPTDDKRN